MNRLPRSTARQRFTDPLQRIELIESDLDAVDGRWEQFRQDWATFLEDQATKIEKINGRFDRLNWYLVGLMGGVTTAVILLLINIIISTAESQSGAPPTP
jgi:hypothetical protein